MQLSGQRMFLNNKRGNDIFARARVDDEVTYLAINRASGLKKSMSLGVTSGLPRGQSWMMNHQSWPRITMRNLLKSARRRYVIIVDGGIPKIRNEVGGILRKKATITMARIICTEKTHIATRKTLASARKSADRGRGRRAQHWGSVLATEGYWRVACCDGAIGWEKCVAVRRWSCDSSKRTRWWALNTETRASIFRTSWKLTRRPLM